MSVPVESNLYTFHHIGLACRSLQSEIKAHELLGYRIEGPAFHDPIQHINGIFMVHGPMRIELIEPVGEHAPVRNIVARGIKMYHQCFEVADIQQSLSDLKSHGAHIIAEPVPAIAFQGRPIAFLILRTSLIVELIQA